MLNRWGFVPVFVLLAGSAVAQTTFTSSGAITIPSSGAATVYPTNPLTSCNNGACINVSGMTGAVQNVTLTFNNWNNTTNEGSTNLLGILLQAPAAGSNGVTSFVVMSNVCKSAGNHTFTLSDSGTANAATSGICFGGIPNLKPSTTHFSGFSLDQFPSPGPGTTYQRAEIDSAPVPGNLTAGSNGHGTFAYSFNGMASANGIWRLYIVSAGGTVSGSPSGGTIGSWAVTITTAGVGATTTTTLQNSSPNPSTTGASVTLTANVTSTSTVNTGTVTFTDNTTATALGTSNVNASGVATLNTSFATEGIHRLTAVYNGGGAFAASGTSNAVIHTAIKASTSQVSPPGGTVGFCNTGGVSVPTSGATNSQGPGNPFPSYITVSGVSGLIQSMRVYLNGYNSTNPVGTGFMVVGPNNKSLEFDAWVGGSTTVSSLNLIFDDAAASSAQPTVSFASGSYKPTVGPQFASSRYCQSTTPSSCNNIQVSEAAPNPFELAGPNASPARTLTSQFLGGSANGTWKLFTDQRQNPFATSITGWCVNFTMGSGTGTTTTVTATPNPATTGAAVSLTATVTPASGPTINEGTVTFSDSVTGANIGAATAVANGTATLPNITNLSEGTHLITATYSGTANFGASTGTFTARINNPTVATTPSGTFKYCNQASGIALPGLGQLTGAAYPYPSNMIVTNMPGTVKTVEVDINGFTSTSPQGTQSLLVGPCQSGSCALDFFSNPSSASTLTNLNLLFLDAAASTIPAGSFGSGSYRPYSRVNTNSYASPAPTGFNYAAPAGIFTLNSTNGIFQNSNGNGTWSLFMSTNVTQANATSVSNWCLVFTNNPPVLSLTKAGPTSVTQGQTGVQYTLTANNAGPGPTAGTVTVTETPGAGMTVTGISGTNWSCTQPAGPCTRSDSLAQGSSYEAITVTVNIANNATTGTGASSNSGTVSGGGTASAVNSNTLSINVAAAPVLSVTKSHSGNFTQGQNGNWTVQVANSGGASVGTITVSDTLPTGYTLSTFSGSGWSCSGTNAVTCISTTVAPANGTLPLLTLTVAVPATSQVSVSNTARVFGGGDLVHTNSGNAATSSDTVTVNQVPATINRNANTSPQSANINTLFATSLGVTVFDAASVLIPGVSVVFTAPPSGPSGTFSNSTATITVVTNGSGQASAPFTANGTGGGPYSVTAAAGAVNTSFSLTNVNPAQNVTVNVPAGVSFTLNGQTLTGSQTVQLTPGTYPLSTTATQSLGAGIRAVFSSWSDAGAISHNITVVSSPLTITGNFTTQFQLTTAAGAGGTVTPATGTFFDSGTVVNVTASPNSGFVFGSWTGPVASASSAATTVTMDAAKSITANFIAQQGVTINVPAGISYTFNGQTVTGSQTFNVAPGTYPLSTTQTQSLGAGVRAQFTSWSDAGAISHNVTVASSPLTITGTFTTQFQLTTAAGTGGTVTPATGTFYDSGTVVNVTATPNGGFVFANWTGPVASASSAATTVTMDAAKSITANFTALQGVTINVPAGISYTFNGQTVTGSQTFNVAPGTYPLSTTQTQSLGAGVRAQFTSWSDAGAISHNVTVASSPLTITGTFTTQFQLTTAAGAGGTVTPATGTFFDSGTVVNVTASPNSGFVFGSWTGPVASASSAATTVTMDAAKSITANFIAQQGVTINVPAGISYTFNGQTVTGSQTFNVAPGTYPLSTTQTQSLGSGVRAQFVSWSDAGAITHNITVASSPLTITGTFTTQFQLTTAAGAGGTVTPATGTFYDSGTVVNVTASPNSGFVFGSWTGPVASASSAATTVTMDAAKSITANFIAQQGVTINVPAGISYTFNGQTVTGSQTFNVAPGTYPLSTTQTQSLGAGVRAQFVSWSDAGAISQNITVASSPLTITGTFTTQFQLTTAAGAGGTVTPATGTFYDSGTVVNVTASPNSGFVFANWTGPVANANAAATTVTMDAAKSITANFTAQQGVTINVPAGISYSLNGQSLTGTQTVQLAPGSYPLSTTQTQSLGSGVRAQFVSWSDAGAITHNITVASSPLTITGTFTTQFQLTTAAGAGGTVTPATGTFYDSGTVVNVTASPNSGFVFANWTGPVANANAAATTVTMDAAKSITANFTAQQGVTINVPAGISYSLNGQSLTGTQTVQLAPGSYPLSTTQTQSLGSGVRAQFVSWSDAGAISHNITVASSPLTITGTFTTQFQLTTAAGAGGTVTPATGTFYDSGTVVNVTASPNSGFVFANWTGPVANANAAATTVTMDAAKSITANFSLIPPAPDVTGQMTVTPGGVVFSRATGRYSQVVTLTNNGTALAASALVLDNLAAGYTAFAPSGVTVVATPAGSPYVEAGPIAAGGSVTITVQFTRTGTPTLTYTPRVLGAGPR